MASNKRIKLTIDEVCRRVLDDSSSDSSGDSDNESDSEVDLEVTNLEG
jgi:hypothetical protein